MVRAILEGRKTQTRRVVKLPHENPLGTWEPTTFAGTDARGVEHEEQAAIWHTRTGETLGCPHGQPGDRLWVRETFKDVCSGQIKDGYGEVRYGTAYAADNSVTWRPTPTIIHDLTGQPTTGPMQFQERPWRPSIHMPRRACRLKLEITGVRVERLQDLSQADAIAEGIERHGTAPSLWKRGPLRGDQNITDGTGFPKLAFRSVWEAISGADSWAANPWVWVVEFRKVTP